MAKTIVFLIDNGSLRPQATLKLRSLAQAISVRSGLRIEAVSLLHSHKIPAEKLNGEAATIFKRRLREYVAIGYRDFACLPLFIGPSLAVSDYLPELIAEQSAHNRDLRVRIAPVLCGENIDDPDPRLAEILAEQVRQLGPTIDTKVGLIDHGSPIEKVNVVRNALARQLAHKLNTEVHAVKACSMERRDGDNYKFNEPLLEKLGDFEDFKGGRLILAMLFLLPGRHAGIEGDVAEIANSLLAKRKFEAIEMTPLLGDHPQLLDILEDRLEVLL